MAYPAEDTVAIMDADDSAQPSPVEDKPSVHVAHSEETNGHHSDSSHDGQQYHVYKRRWFGIVCLACLNIVISWGWLSFSAISSDAQTFFNLSNESPINWLSTVILFSYLVSSPVVWWVLGKYSVRTTIIAGAGLTIIGSWVRYGGTKANSFGAVIFGQILIGLAQPFALNTPTYYTDLWFTSNTRVSANAIASLANPFGAAIGQLVGPALVEGPEDMPTFILVTSIVATAFSLFSCLIPSSPPLPPCPSGAIVKLHWIESIKMLFKNPRYCVLFVQFSIYVGFFNAYSTFLNQIMEPYGYSSDEAGIAGALLIFVGIAFTIVTSIMADRLHWYRGFIMIFVPLIAALYIGAIFMCSKDGNVAGPYVVSALQGALSFSLLPIFLEWSQEQISPVNPAVAASVQWMGGQLFGAVFIIAMNALKYPDDKGDPPANMRRALIFEAAIAGAGVIPVYFLRSSKADIRVAMDKAHREHTMSLA